MQAGDPVEWFSEIPPVSRTYLALSSITTAACALDLISPFALYYNYKLIFHKGQVWRLFTNFLFFGQFGLDFLFHMYFLVRYSRLLEENSFRQRTADFVWMLLFGAACMTLFAPFVTIHFLGSSLTFMMVYVWGRRNRHERLSFLGMFPFTAPFLPWVLLVFSLLLNNTGTIDGIGIAVGHLYYYLEDVWPAVADARGWKRRKLLKTPYVIVKLVELFQGRPAGTVDIANDDLAGPALVPAMPAAALAGAAGIAAAADGGDAVAGEGAGADADADADGGAAPQAPPGHGPGGEGDAPPIAAGDEPQQW